MRDPEERFTVDIVRIISLRATFLHIENDTRCPEMLEIHDKPQGKAKTRMSCVLLYQRR